MTGVDGIATDFYLYLIPVYNSVQILSSIFALEMSVTNFVVTVVSNLIYIVLGIFALSKMFQSEKIMFNK